MDTSPVFSPALELLGWSFPDPLMSHYIYLPEWKRQPDIPPTKRIYSGKERELQLRTCSHDESHTSLLKLRGNYFIGKKKKFLLRGTNYIHNTYDIYNISYIL